MKYPPLTDTAYWSVVCNDQRSAQKVAEAFGLTTHKVWSVRSHFGKLDAAGRSAVTVAPKKRAPPVPRKQHTLDREGWVTLTVEEWIAALRQGGVLNNSTLLSDNRRDSQ